MWQDLWKKSRRQKNLWDGLRLWWMPPEWDPSQTASEVFEDRGYNENQSVHLNGYLSSQVLLAGAVMAVLMLLDQTLPLWVSVAGVGWVFCTILAWGGLFENKTWGKALELVKFIVPLGAALCFIFLNKFDPPPLLAVAGVCTFYLLWFSLKEYRFKKSLIAA